MDIEPNSGRKKTDRSIRRSGLFSSREAAEKQPPPHFNFRSSNFSVHMDRFFDCYASILEILFIWTVFWLYASILELLFIRQFFWLYESILEFLFIRQFFNWYASFLEILFIWTVFLVLNRMYASSVFRTAWSGEQYLPWTQCRQVQLTFSCK